MVIDLRSDTVTKPTEEMRAAMATAEVGDDVFGEDPTVDELQSLAVQLFRKDNALFVPSGTMGNQIAVRCHTNPGDDVVIESRGHIFRHELGVAAAISGVTLRPVVSKDGSGQLTIDEIFSEVMSGSHVPYYIAQTGLVCLENTHNLAGGSVRTADDTADICRAIRGAGLPVHLDGARIFNAAAATGSSVADHTAYCDSVMFCLSKGLGAPVGSMLVGTREFIEKARIWRKRLGGGMRQAGVLAAAGLIALREGPKQLPIDHANARKLAGGLSQIGGISLDPAKVVTNIVIADLADAGTAQGLVEHLAVREIRAFAFAQFVRFVTHRDVDESDIDETLAAVREITESR